MDYIKGVLDKGATSEEVADDIAARFDEGIKANGDALDEIEQIRAHLNGDPPDLPAWKHPDDPNYTVPYMETLVDTIIAKFFMAVLAHNPIIRFLPENKKSVLAARLVERTVHYLTNKRIPNAFTHLYLWIHEAVSVGLGLLYVYYDRVERKYTQMTTVYGPDGAPQIDEEGKTVRVPELVTEVDYEGFKLDVLDLQDVTGDWENIDNEEYIVREYIEPKEYLHRVKTLGYVEMTMEELKELTSSNKSKRDYVSTTENIDDKFRDKIEILHYHGLGYIDDGDELENVKITVFKKKANDGERREIVRTSSAMCPIIPMRFKPVLKKFQGRGVGQQTKDLNTELNINFNSRLLNLSHALHTGWIIGSEAGLVDEDELTSRPGMTIHCDKPEQVVPITRAAVTQEAFSASEETKATMRDVTAAQDIVQGKAQRQELATTATLLDSNAKQRLEVHIFRMAKEGFGKYGDILKIGITELFDPDNPIMLNFSKDEMDQFAGQFPDGAVDENGMMEISSELLRGAMYATTEVSALAGDTRSQRQELLQLIQMVMQMTGGQGWPTGQTDPKTGAPIMERLNFSNSIKEMYRLWGLNGIDIKSMIEQYAAQPPPQEGGGGQQKQAGPGSEPPGYSAAPNPAEMQARLTAAMDQAVTEG